MKYTARNSEITASTPFQIIGDFTELGFASLMIGIIFGLLSSYVLKQYRIFAKNPVSESMMIFCFGYLSYVISEVSESSGIISLLTAGVVMAHYTWYNLSPQGKQSSFIVFQFLGYATEAFVFAYLGLTFFTYTDLKWSPSLFLAELGVILVGRFFGTIGLMAFMRMIGFKSDITLKELIFIWYAGMIRGAIAFGLVLRIDSSYANRGVIVTTSLSLVVFTTVFYGSTVGLLQLLLFKKEEPEAERK
jgi:NhaP-type Na+/H+ or K+/H+ antiporter